MIALDLPFPPSVNRYWRHNRGRTHISDAGRAYRDQVAWQCKARKTQAIEGPVKVGIGAVAPDRRRRDLDNLLKCVLDALQIGGCYRDDSQIESLNIEWIVGVSPGLQVTIWPCSPENENDSQ